MFFFYFIACSFLLGSSYQKKEKKRKKDLSLKVLESGQVLHLAPCYKCNECDTFIPLVGRSMLSSIFHSLQT